MAEALKRLVARTARRRVLPWVVGGVLIGAIACYLMNFALLKTGTPGLGELAGAAIILICVIVRFRE